MVSVVSWSTGKLKNFEANDWVPRMARFTTMMMVCMFVCGILLMDDGGMDGIGGDLGGKDRLKPFTVHM